MVKGVCKPTFINHSGHRIYTKETYPLMLTHQWLVFKLFVVYEKQSSDKRIYCSFKPETANYFLQLIKYREYLCHNYCTNKIFLLLFLCQKIKCKSDSIENSIKNIFRKTSTKYQS